MFQKVGQSCGGFLLLNQIGFVRIHKRDSLHVTEGHTLGVTITVVAFHRDPFLVVKEGLTEGTGDNTGSASNTEVFINDDPILVFWFPVAGLCRADFKAVCCFAVVAGHGKVDADLFPLDDFDPGATRIARSSVKDRADHLTLTAACAFLLIHHQYLLLHFCLH